MGNIDAPEFLHEDEQRLLAEPTARSETRIEGEGWWRRPASRTHLAFLYVTNVVTLLILLSEITARPRPVFGDFYSPAGHLIKYKETVFLDNIYQLSPFQGPPDETKDTMWDLLYRNTSSTVVAAADAKGLPNRTMVLPGTNGDGIISLEVFHQLHCLNSLRKSLYPERFPDYSVFFPNHTRDPGMSVHHDHCIDRLRQGVMCASDLGAMYWTWNEHRRMWRPNMSTTHMCRNFEDIRQWAVAHNLPNWDETVPSRLTD